MITQLDIFKTKLETELDLVTNELQSLGVENPTAPGDWIPTPLNAAHAESDPNDLADRSEEWQERRGTLDVLEARYTNLNRALEKITIGTFGRCELCQKEIEADRLEANPAARTCKEHINDESDLNI